MGGKPCSRMEAVELDTQKALVGQRVSSGCSRFYVVNVPEVLANDPKTELYVHVRVNKGLLAGVYACADERFPSSSRALWQQEHYCKCTHTRGLQFSGSKGGDQKGDVESGEQRVCDGNYPNCRLTNGSRELCPECTSQSLGDGVQAVVSHSTKYGHRAARDDLWSHIVTEQENKTEDQKEQKSSRRRDRDEFMESVQFGQGAENASHGAIFTLDMRKDGGYKGHFGEGSYFITVTAIGESKSKPHSHDQTVFDIWLQSRETGRPAQETPPAVVDEDVKEEG